MQIRVQKWGNSLALRIPRVFAESAKLKDNTVVEISLVGEKIVIVLARPPKPNLKTLLSKITPDNIHAEIDFGAPVGNEAKLAFPMDFRLAAWRSAIKSRVWTGEHAMRNGSVSYPPKRSKKSFRNSARYCLARNRHSLRARN